MPALNYSPEDLDYMVRTVYGEAGNQSPVGQQGVAAVIANRASQSGLSPRDVVLAKNQFEPWSSRKDELMALDPNSDQYKGILNNIQPFLNGDVADPTNGATHFYAPKAQAALGRAAPSWDNGKGVDIEDHRFFNIGWNGKDAQPLQPGALSGQSGQNQMSGGAGSDQLQPASLSSQFLAGGPGALFGRPQEGWNVGDTLTRVGAAMLARDKPEAAQALLSPINAETNAQAMAARYGGKNDKNQQHFDPVTGKVITVGPDGKLVGTVESGGRPDKPLPVGAANLLTKQSDAADAAANTMDKMNQIRDAIVHGNLDLGALSRTDFNVQAALNTPGVDEKTKNTARYLQMMQELRNEKLLQAKGVQTEGDAQRAMEMLTPGLSGYNTEMALDLLDKGIGDLRHAYSYHTGQYQATNKAYSQYDPEGLITKQMQDRGNGYDSFEKNYAPAREQWLASRRGEGGSTAPAGGGVTPAAQAAIERFNKNKKK